MLAGWIDEYKKIEPEKRMNPMASKKHESESKYPRFSLVFEP
jgi:hypothetical protein